MNLALPLSQNPKTRPILRRVFAIVSVCVISIVSGFTLASFVYHRDRITSITPATATFALRFVQTPATRELEQKLFSSSTITPTSSIPLTDLLNEANREVVIYIGSDGDVIGFASDTPMAFSQDVLASQRLKSIALPWRGQLITKNSLAVNSDRPSFRLSWHTGELIDLTQKTTTPLTVTATSIRLKKNIGNITSPDLAPFATPGTPLLRMAVPIAQTKVLLSLVDIPLVYEGTRALFAQASVHGLSLQIAQDSHGKALSLRVPQTELTQQEQRSILKEWSSNIESVDAINLIITQKIQELRNTNKNNPRIITATPGNTITQTKKDDNANITLSVTNSQVTLTNRQEANSGFPQAVSCHNQHSTAYIMPQMVKNAFSSSVFFPPTDLERILLSFSTILWTTHETDFCL